MRPTPLLARSFFLLSLGAALAAACSGGGNAGSGSSGQGGAADGGGSGGDGGCKSDAECAPSGDCKTVACVAGACVEELAPAGKIVFSGLVPGDCKRRQCAADGSVEEVADENDKPDDHNPCTLDTCTAGQPTHAPDPAKDGAACGVSGQAKCANGLCTGCNTPGQCPLGGPCEIPTCTAQGLDKVCGFMVAVGHTISNVDPSDCYQAACDASGLIVTVPAPADVPPADANECDVEACSESGAVMHTPVADGTACGGSTECMPKGCTGGLCEGLPLPAAGTAIAAQTGGDCKLVVCDGLGGTSEQPDETDKPGDANPSDCVVPACDAAGSPTMVNAPAQTPCAGGVIGVCDGMGTCL